MDFNVLNTTYGDKVMGGYKSRLLVIPVCYVKEIPKPVETITELADYVKVSGTFSYADSKKPIVVDAKSGSINYKAETQGEEGAQTFKPSGTFAVKDKMEADALAALTVNTNCYLVLEEHNGKQLVIGNTSFPAIVKPAFDGGTKAADARGYTFTFEVEGQFTSKQYLQTPIDMDALVNP